MSLQKTLYSGYETSNEVSCFFLKVIRILCYEYYTLAYNTVALITYVKSFVVLPLGSDD
jgi:hypothetical protein